MKWNISNNKRNMTLAIVAGLVAFSTIFLLTGVLLTSVYGLKPGDVGYIVSGVDPTTGIINTPYQDFIINGCLTKPFIQGDQTVVLDTKGLDELGLFYYDPNTCFDVAKNTPGYNINKVETYGEDQMKITLTKK